MSAAKPLRRWPEPGPAYLEAVAEVTVRFQEVDSMGVVWHGHYLTFFEEGRAAFGRRYGLSYQDVFAAGCLIPIVRVEVDYAAPARFGDTLRVVARLYPDDAARLLFSYEVQGPAGQALARGRTLQLFTTLEGAPVLTRPPVFDGFLERWRGELQTP